MSETNSPTHEQHIEENISPTNDTSNIPSTSSNLPITPGSARFSNQRDQHVTFRPATRQTPSNFANFSRNILSNMQSLTTPYTTRVGRLVRQPKKYPKIILINSIVKMYAHISKHMPNTTK